MSDPTQTARLSQNPASNDAAKRDIQTTEALAQTIRLAYYTELCRKPPNSFVMRDWGLLVTIERAPWLAAAKAVEAEFNVR